MSLVFYVTAWSTSSQGLFQPHRIGPAARLAYPWAQLTWNSRILSSHTHTHLTRKLTQNWSVTWRAENLHFDSFLPFSNLCWFGCSLVPRDDLPCMFREWKQYVFKEECGHLGTRKVNFNLKKLPSSPLRSHSFRAHKCVKGFVPLYGEKEIIKQKYFRG